MPTDIIVKCSREVQFVYKVNIADGKSNLILDYLILEGNHNDRTLFEPTLKRIEHHYGKTPRDVSVDGAYSSLNNK